MGSRERRKIRRLERDVAQLKRAQKPVLQRKNEDYYSYKPSSQVSQDQINKLMYYASRTKKSQKIADGFYMIFLLAGFVFLIGLSLFFMVEDGFIVGILKSCVAWFVFYVVGSVIKGIAGLF
jgi:hypothetical protein